MPRLLLDENFPAPSTKRLLEAGLDAVAVAPASAGAEDTHVLARAVKESRWLVTFDRDYGELVFKRGLPAPPALILLRVPHYRPHQPADWLIRIVEREVEVSGQFVVFNGRSLRMRPLLRLVEPDSR